MTESQDKPLAETVDTIRNTPVIPITEENQSGLKDYYILKDNNSLTFK